MRPQRKAGVIACSAGNHAQGVAYHAARLGIPAVIVMPRHTPYVKVEHTQKHGAEVILEGDNFDEAKSCAIEQAGKRALTLVHPYDDQKIIAGQGTCGLEMHDGASRSSTRSWSPSAAAGSSRASRSRRRRSSPPSRCYGVEMVRFPAMYHAMKGTEPHVRRVHHRRGHRGEGAGQARRAR